MSPELAEVEDPDNPAVILRGLPEQERAELLRQYYAAVDAAHDPGGYRQLQGLLHAWQLMAIATSRAGYYEELAAVRSGTADQPSRRSLPGLAEVAGGGAGSDAVTYRAEQERASDLVRDQIPEVELRDSNP